MIQNVLDKGFIEVVDSLGDDLTVVNSARVSFGKRKKKWDKRKKEECRKVVQQMVPNGMRAKKRYRPESMCTTYLKFRSIYPLPLSW